MSDSRESTYTTYVLAQDVENPTPDRRFRHDWTKAERWLKRKKFEIEKVGEVEVIRLMTRGVGSSRSMSLARHPEAFAALRPYLVAVPTPAMRAPTITIEDAEKLVHEACNDLVKTEPELIAYVVGLTKLRDEILARLKKLRLPEQSFSCCGGSDENPPNHTQDCSRNE